MREYVMHISDNTQQVRIMCSRLVTDSLEIQQKHHRGSILKLCNCNYYTYDTY